MICYFFFLPSLPLKNCLYTKRKKKKNDDHFFFAPNARRQTFL